MIPLRSLRLGESKSKEGISQRRKERGGKALMVKRSEPFLLMPRLIDREIRQIAGSEKEGEDR